MNKLNLKKINMRLERGTKSVNSRKSAPLPAEPAKAMAPAVPAPPKTSTTSRNGTKPVTIEAKIDVGFGNALYLRGEGQGLSWNRGIPLACVDGSTWKWSGAAEDALKFKLLLNDAVWAKGEDLVVAPGQRVQVSPAF